MCVKVYMSMCVHMHHSHIHALRFEEILIPIWTIFKMPSLSQIRVKTLEHALPSKIPFDQESAVDPLFTKPRFHPVSSQLASY